MLLRFKSQKSLNIQSAFKLQIFTHILGIEGMPHNGTWDRVKDMFVDSGSSAAQINCALIVTLSSLVYFIMY